jgi:hypothetical protein
VNLPVDTTITVWLVLLAYAVTFFAWALGWFVYEFTHETRAVRWAVANVRFEWPPERETVTLR